MTFLAIEDLDAGYGYSQVLWQINLAIKEHEIAVLVGPNGAGKTTLMRTIAGLLKPTKGKICLRGHDITANSAEQRVHDGIALVPEGRRLFSGLTVFENLRMGAYLRHDRASIKRSLEQVMTYFPALTGLRDRSAGTLSGGEQQMCAIGRALMSTPSLLLVDEMSLGLAPVITEGLAEVLRQINKDIGTTMVIVEQDIELALEIGTRGYVLELGMIRHHGSTAELLARSDIREVYLGL